MKRSLIALAALAASGAFAQSTVSIWGAVDASFNYATADLANGKSENKQSLGSSQLGSSKLGFSGVEDLGGGLKAKFWLEGGLSNDSGAGKGSNSNNQASGVSAAGLAGSQGIVFQRRSYVGLVGNFGEVQLGRQYVNTFLGVQAAVDPFGTNGPADSTQMMLALGATKSSYTITNASNMITYITPTVSGFSANIQAFMGENASGAANSDDGGGYSVTGMYAMGPLFVSAGQQQTKNSVTGEYTLQGLSASYDLGVAKLVFTTTHEGVAGLAGTADYKNNANLFGVIVPMGAYSFKASYVTATNNMATKTVDQKGELFGVGVDYSLSKRSKLYATYGSIKNSDGGSGYGAGVIGALAANGGTTNLAVGIFHAF